MLCAFDCHIAIFDRATFNCALERINGVVKDRRIEDAVFIPMSDEGAGEPRSLRTAPKLDVVREACLS